MSRFLTVLKWTGLVLVTLLVMRQFNMTFNLMTLGGIASAIGL